MMITKTTLNRVTFENEDARLLVLDIVSHTSACLYYYDTEIEITVLMALKMRERAYRADCQDSMYSVSFMPGGRRPFRTPLKTRERLGAVHGAFSVEGGQADAPANHDRGPWV